MKIVIIGGTGLIGSNVASKLRQLGHTVIAASPSTGIDAITGEGLSQALEKAEVVIDLSNSASPEADTALHFFQTAGRNLAAAEKTAGVKHHLVLSIVGTDRAPHIGYLQAKKNQEDIIKESGIPFTIIRATQFHEHITTLIAVQSQGDQVHVSTLDYQPIAAEDVATLITQLSLEAPKNGTVEIAGPDRAPMNDFVTKYLAIKGEAKVVAVNDDNQYMFFTMPKSGLVPEGDFYAGIIRFDDWAKN
ncbi:SDR family oxidoreductase [Siphonobacter curvatus]|uniref:NmrA family transcriptional regulator n=1 Tax=Siphonobacter curvatus TaxID=2094562 RepID=A0A2S7IEU5_9BACT|nr:NAD(P)H-binding protein [Siphonobacter curvatus]PQA53424.1 NmrA family transcriptional regulator [Siphonobacter curvatus]